MKDSLSKRGRFMLAVAVQLAIIAAIIISKLSVLAGGTEVLLRIEPVDPRDLLRGDYITFQYSISQLGTGLFEDHSAREGETVYVVLRRSGQTWDAVRVLKHKPRAGELFLKGKVQNAWGAAGTYHILYGIEEYFIPEGTGGFLPAWNRNDFAAARVVVDESGNAVIKEILINDRPWPQTETSGAK